jgi:ABC-type uncharacterized transport system fused permease/ATPase subunit
MLAPALLVLDEATSHLDIERERQVNAAVNRIRITRIVIAHRLETIANAQRVRCWSPMARCNPFRHPIHTKWRWRDSRIRGGNTFLE